MNNYSQGRKAGIVGVSGYSGRELLRILARHGGVSPVEIPREGEVGAAALICDSKSGVSGAGHKPNPKTHFCSVQENFSAYGILEHRHVPEMVQALGVPFGDFCFTAHLLPVDRGILSTIYVKLARAAS